MKFEGASKFSVPICTYKKQIELWVTSVARYQNSNFPTLKADSDESGFFRSTLMESQISS